MTELHVLNNHHNNLFATLFLLIINVFNSNKDCQGIRRKLPRIPRTASQMKSRASPFSFYIRHLRNEKGAGAEMRPAVSGIISQDKTRQDKTRQDNILFGVTSLVTAPEVFAKINSAQFPSPF